MLFWSEITQFPVYETELIVKKDLQLEVLDLERFDEQRINEESFKSY